MNNFIKNNFLIYFIALLLVFILQSESHGATQITGTVTAKRADSVKLEFKPHKETKPINGDQVDFKTMIQGLEVSAGQGEVTESESGFVWVRIIKGRPNLKMSGIIHATGEPSTDAHLTVRSNVSGDIWYLDGKTMGPTGARVQNVKPGRHQLRVEKPGYHPYAQTLKLIAGSAKTIHVKLKTIQGIWKNISIKYDDSSSTGLTLRMPSDWKLDNSDTGNWHIFMPRDSVGYDFHVRVRVNKKVDPTSKQQLTTLKKGRKNLVNSNTTVLEGPEYSYIDGHKAYYAKIRTEHDVFPELLNGSWVAIGYELFDNNRYIYIYALCKSTVCTDSIERKLKTIIRSAKFPNEQ